MQLYLPGSGAALELYRLGRELGKLEVVVLSKFCEEGDNRKDTLWNSSNHTAQSHLMLLQGGRGGAGARGQHAAGLEPRHAVLGPAQLDPHVRPARARRDVLVTSVGAAPMLCL